MTSDVYEQLVPHSHYLRKVAKTVDFGFVDEMCKSKYKVLDGGPGRPPEPPQRLFKLLFLMFLYQVKFERELERRANDSLAWRWFCGYGLDEHVASHKTLWLFRKRLGPEIFDEIFARIVQQCIGSKLVDRKRYHIDATKQDAAATTFSQYEMAVILTRAMIERLASMQGVEHGDDGQPPSEMDAEMKTLVAKVASKVARLKKVKPGRILAKAEEREYQPDEDVEHQGNEAEDEQEKFLENLARELESEQSPARGDSDARVGKTSAFSSFCGYLTTAVVDEKHGIVLGCKTVAGNVDQGKTLLPAYDKAVQVAGKPEEMAADRAFDLQDIRRKMKQDKVKAYIPMIKTHRNGGVLSSEHFVVKEAGDAFTVSCPAGLKMKQLKKKKSGLTVFRGTGCIGCHQQSKCTTAKDGIRCFEFTPELRKLQEEYWSLRKTDEYKEAMKARMATIEPIFGHGKTFHNLGKSIYRSLSMQKIQSAMSLLIVNVEKLVKYAPCGA